MIYNIFITSHNLNIDIISFLLKISFQNMYLKILLCLLFLEIIDKTYATTPRANKLLRNICDTLYDNDGLQSDEDKQWEIICQELFSLKDDNPYIRKQRDISNGKNIN